MNRTTSLLQRRAALLGPAYRLFYDDPVELVSSRGVDLVDSEGRHYLDAYNNVASVGHAHPRVVEAIARQAQELNTHTRYLNAALLDFAERFLATFPGPLERVMFTCSGSEAIDLAVRIARAATSASGVIVTAHAYHGTTLLAAGMSPSLGEGTPLGAEVRTVPLPRTSDPVGARAELAASVAAAARDLHRHGHGVAALVADSVFASDGVHPDPAGVLAGAAEAVRAAGGLFVGDEVQAGFGRTGEGMWSFQRHGVSPDLAVMGKPMGNGYPVAAVVARADLVDTFAVRGRYFNTFGGTPVAIAAAGAVLDVIEEEGLVANARETGRHLGQVLRGVADGSARLGEVRGVGLFHAVDVVDDDGRVDPRGAAALANGLRHAGVLVGLTGPTGASLKIRPPLVFSRAHADRLGAALAQTLPALPAGGR